MSSIQVPRATDIEVVAGDYFPLSVVLAGDYSTAVVQSQVRSTQHYQGTLLGTFVVTSQTYDGTYTTVVMHLTPTDTRAMGAYEICYYDFCTTVYANQPHTWFIGQLIMVQDVTA